MLQRCKDAFPFLPKLETVWRIEQWKLPVTKNQTGAMLAPGGKGHSEPERKGQFQPDEKGQTRL